MVRRGRPHPAAVARVAKAAAALAVVALAGSTAPASAATWSVTDPAHDVHTYSYSADPPPCGTWTEEPVDENGSTDITAFTVDHAKTRVVLTVEFRNLRKKGQHETSLALNAQGKRFSIDVRRARTGAPVRHSFWRESKPEPADECGTTSVMGTGRTCHDLRVDLQPGLDTLTVSVPRTCLKAPDWVRAGLSTYRELSGDAGVDSWDPGTDAWYGPRVARG